MFAAVLDERRVHRSCRAIRAQAGKPSLRLVVSNREKAPDLLADELDAAFARLASAPTLIRVYRESKGRRIRRLLLPRTSYHVFFEVDEAKRQVHVLAIWHTARARGPRL